MKVADLVGFTERRLRLRRGLMGFLARMTLAYLVRLSVSSLKDAWMSKGHSVAREYAASAS